MGKLFGFFFLGLVLLIIIGLPTCAVKSYKNMENFPLENYTCEQVEQGLYGALCIVEWKTYGAHKCYQNKQLDYYHRFNCEGRDVE